MIPRAATLVVILALAPGAGGWDASAGYNFEKGLLLTYTLSLETEIHYDLDRIELFIPVRSRYSLRFFTLEKSPAGEAVLAAVSKLEDISLPQDQPGSDAPLKDRIKRIKTWLSTLVKTDSAAVVFDPQGNILRGRMPWPDGTCYQMPLVLAGISLRKKGWDGNVGGRFQIENSFRGMAAGGAGDQAVFTSGNNLMQARLLVDTGKALPVRYDAKYGYQTFQSVFAQALKMELTGVEPGRDPAAVSEDPDMLTAVIQAATLGGLDLQPSTLLSGALASPLPVLRQSAAAHLAAKGIPDGLDTASALMDKDELVRFNIAKALFRWRGDRSALVRFLDDGAVELRLRAGRFLERPETTGADADLIRAVEEGRIPDGRSEAEIYGAARARLQGRKERTFFQIGPSEFGLASGLSGRRIYHVAVHCPIDYDPTETWPVLINLSGGNGFAESAFLVIKDLVPSHYILVSPDAGYGNWWDPDQLRMFNDLLKRLVRDYALDPDRVYLQGFSNGGIGTYRFASLHPDRFAAVSSLEGFSKPPGEKREVETEMMLNLVNTPVLIIHGERDRVISIEPDRILAEFLRRNSIPFQFLAVEGAGHTLSFETHKDDLLSFFRKYRRDPAPTKLNLVMDESAEGRAYWVRIDRKKDPSLRASVRAEIKKGRIVVETRNVAVLSFLLNDLHGGPEPVEIVVDKKRVFQGRLRLDPAALAESLKSETDYARLYGVKLTFEVQAP